MKAFFEANRPHDGLTYEEYLTRWEREQDAAPTAAMSKKERKMLHYKKYNYQRTQAVHDAYAPSDALRGALKALDAPQLWMVLTEPWCGDSAYNLPVIAEAADVADAVTLRILYRDQNLDIMDQYLTDGGRSIPKLVAFHENGQELFTWGPRPGDLQAFRQQLIAQDVSGKDVVQRLLDRYEEGAWQQVDDELVAALQSAEAISA
jgi:hypothetical protein